LLAQLLYDGVDEFVEHAHVWLARKSPKAVLPFPMTTGGSLQTDYGREKPLLARRRDLGES
jgi:hypothetical protein